MKFTKFIGKVDENDHELKDVIKQAQDKLSIAFTELSLGYSSRIGGSIGGDPFIFQLSYPMHHICDLTAFYLKRQKNKEDALDKRKAAGETILPEEDVSDDAKAFRKRMGGQVLTTAATTGTKLYYNPLFVNKLSKLGVRIVLQHEALHGALMHPQRRGTRKPGLFNIAVDMKVNYLILQDLKSRGFHDFEKMFKENLGDYITVAEYAAFLKDPYNPPEKMKHFNPGIDLKKELDPAYVDPSDANKAPLYFADPGLEGDMRRPEFIYDYLYSMYPSCPECGRKPFYEKPEWYKVLLRQKKEMQKDIDKHCHRHATTYKGNKTCPDCCQTCHEDEDEPDPCGGDLVDEHFNDFDLDSDQMNKRLHDAAEMARRMGGSISGGMQEEIGELSRPKMTFSDFIRMRMNRIANDSGRADWTRFKRKYMCAGMLFPRKKSTFCKMAVLCDSSGSMSISEDVAYGISQLQVISQNCEAYIGFFDVAFYPESIIKLNKARPEEFKAKIQSSNAVGRGGSSISQALKEYEKHTNGPVDLLVIITDTGLIETPEQINELLPSKTEIVILCTREESSEFRKVRGRHFNLR